MIALLLLSNFMGATLAQSISTTSTPARVSNIVSLPTISAISSPYSMSTKTYTYTRTYSSTTYTRTYTYASPYDTYSYSYQDDSTHTYSSSTSTSPTSTSPTTSAVATPSANASVVQVDLIFPRANETYRPVYPFPIVFAVHNLKAAWPFLPGLYFGLYAHALPRTPRDFSRVELEQDVGYNWLEFDSWGSPDSPSPIWKNLSAGPTQQDPTILIFSTPKISTYSRTTFNLTYSFMLQGNCSEYSDLYRQWRDSDDFDDNNHPYTINGAISFQTSDQGSLPNITSQPCPQNNVSGAIAILGTSPKNASCANLQSPFINPKECATKIDDTIGKRVAAEMVAKSHCKGVSWPSISLAGECFEKSSAASSPGPDWFWALAISGIVSLLSSMSVV